MPFWTSNDPSFHLGWNLFPNLRRMNGRIPTGPTAGHVGLRGVTSRGPDKGCTRPPAYSNRPPVHAKPLRLSVTHPTFTNCSPSAASCVRLTYAAPDPIP